MLGLSNSESVDYVVVARRSIESYINRVLLRKNNSERKQVIEELERLARFIQEKYRTTGNKSVEKTPKCRHSHSLSYKTPTKIIRMPGVTMRLPLYWRE